MKKLLHRISFIPILLAVLLIAWPARATTYYYRADGSAANKGAATSCSDASTSMNATVLNGETFSAGDIITNCGDDVGGITRTTIVPPSSGSSGSPITFNCAAGKTCIYSGANILSAESFSAYASSPSLVQSKTSASAYGTSDSLTFDSAITEGNLIVVVFGIRNNDTITFPAGYTKTVVSEDVGLKTVIAWKIAAASEPTTLNFSWTSDNYSMIWAGEYSNIDATPLDDFAVSDSDNAGVTELASGDVTASTASTLMISAVSVKVDPSAFGWTNSFSEIVDLPSSGANAEIDVASRVVSSTGDYNTTVSWTTSQPATMGIIAFKGSSSGSTYQIALTTDPGNYVLEDGSMMTKVASIELVGSTEGSYYWDSDVLYIHATGDGDPSSNGKVYETPIRNIVISQNQKDYLTFQNLTVQMSTYIGLYASDASKQDGITVDGCLFRYAVTGMTLHGDDAIVQKSEFTKLTNALELRDIDNSHCQDFLITKNYFHDLGQSTTADSGVLYDSDSYADNADYHKGVTSYNKFVNLIGRAMDGFCGESLWIGNVVNGVANGAAGSGIALEVNGPNNKVYNNTFYDIENIGLMFNTDPVAPDVQSEAKNNIIDASSVNHIVWVTNDAGLSPTFDNNDYWMGSGGETKYYWKGTDYTFTNWKTQSSGDANSVEADPLMTDPSSGDFTLQAGSPAIDAGADLGDGSVYLALGAASTWPDGVVTVNQDTTNPPWDIGAYGGYAPLSESTQKGMNSLGLGLVLH